MDSSNTNDPTIHGYPPLVPHPKGYALSGKIMLSAIIILFGVVVIMVCFHIYARWYILRARRRNVRRARRRTHLVFYIDPNNASDFASNTATVTRGLDAGVVDSLPTFVYDGKISRKVVDDEENDDVEVLECAVCLSEFEVGEKGRVLPKCRHCFHVECIDMWFHSHDTCPLCRAPVEVDTTGLPQPGVEPGSGCEPGSHVVEMDGLAELTQLSQLVESAELRGDVGPSANSVGGRRKGLDLVTIEVPRRCHSFSFMNSDESGSGSGSSRVRSFKRFLSRDRKSPLPSPSPSGSSRVEFDIELGKTNPTTPR